MGDSWESMHQNGALSARDARMALDIAGALAVCRDQAELHRQLGELPRLIGADSGLLTGIDPAGMMIEAGDRALYRRDLLDAAMAHWREHPVIIVDVSGPANGAHRLSDFISSRWRQRGLFGDFYRPLGMTAEISLQLDWGGPGTSLCFVLHRASGDFGDREVAIMNHLRPHLCAARMRVALEARQVDRLGLLGRGLHASGRETVVVGRDGRIVAADETARGVLERWFGGASETMPVALHDWWSAARAQPMPAPFAIIAGQRRLRVQMVPGADEDLLLLTEQDETVPAASRLERLLPLTRREAEVLARLAVGRTNDGIAYDLGISRHTVVRHVERIYLKLGTHTRAAATRVALDALHGER